jgi:two-component system, LytTR family, response regulator
MNRLLKRLRATTPVRTDERLVVSTARGAVVLHFSEIDWIEAAGNYAQLWVGPRHYFLRESLQALEERAVRYGFLRAHRRALVRLDGVRELVRDGDGALIAILGNGARIPISRRRRADFIAAVCA